MIVQQIFNGVMVGSVYVLFSLGLTLVFGVQGILNLAHGSIFMIGAFAGLACIKYLQMPWIAALLGGIIAGAACAILVDTIAFRPLRRRQAPEFSAIVSSLGANLLLLSIAQKFSGTNIMRYPFGAFKVRLYNVVGLTATSLQVTVIGCAALSIALLALFLRQTSMGQDLRAVAASQRTASLLGINANAVHNSTFLLAGGLAGGAGVLIGTLFNSVHYLMGEPYMLRAFVVVVLGGLGSILGTVIAGLIVGVLQVLISS